VFSITGNLVSKKRTRIASKNIQYVLYLRSWGILGENENEEEIKFSIEGKILEPVDRPLVGIFL
jgi:hypothetical protein